MSVHYHCRQCICKYSSDFAYFKKRIDMPMQSLVLIFVPPSGRILERQPADIWCFRFSSAATVSALTYTLSFICFCYELALETSGKCSSIKSLRVHDLCHVHSLASLQWSGPSDQWMLLPTENCLQCQNGAPKNPPTSPYPILFASAKCIFKTDCTN